MTIEFQDVLKTDLVLVGLVLLQQPEELLAFRNAANADVVASGQSMNIDPVSGVTEPGRVLSLDRDRITLNLTPSRSVVRRDFPHEQDLRRLAEVTHHAIRTTSLENQSQSLTAIGYNLEMVYEPSSGLPATRYLAQCLFSDVLSSRSGWNLVGGGGTVVYEENENEWQFSLQPRFREPTNTRIVLGLNLHQRRDSIPSEDEMVGSLQQIWEQSRAFANLLDEGDLQ